MDPLAPLVLSWALVFVMNLAPAFMPPTWSLLAFVQLAFGLPPLPLAIGGAFAASGGRLTLALASRRYARRFISPARRDELETLGRWLDAKARWAAPVAVLVYSFGPIPSNQLFVAAGLTRMALGRIAAAFLAGRLISYPLWIGAARLASSRIEELFAQRLTNVVAIALDLALIASLVLFTRIDWTALIGRFDASFAGARATPRSGTGFGGTSSGVTRSSRLAHERSDEDEADRGDDEPRDHRHRVDGRSHEDLLEHGDRGQLPSDAPAPRKASPVGGRPTKTATKSLRTGPSGPVSASA